MSSSQNSLSSSEPASPFEWVMDVPAALDVTLGSTSLTVRECSRLAVNSVVRLRQPAGTDLELRLAGRPFAAGEVVIADDNVSLRIGRLLPPSSGDAA
jgi:flagellar motor switch/type III secretory pathway protein FliN